MSLTIFKGYVLYEPKTKDVELWVRKINFEIW